MSLKQIIPSCPAATPSVSIQPPSKRRSSLAPAGTKVGSPVGAGNPGSSAKAVTANARVRHRAAKIYWEPYQLFIAPPVITDVGQTTSAGSTGCTPQKLPHSTGLSGDTLHHSIRWNVLFLSFQICNDFVPNLRVRLFIEHHRAGHPSLGVCDPDIECAAIPHHSLEDRLERPGVCKARPTSRRPPNDATQ